MENHLHDFRGLPLNLERNTKIIPKIMAKIIETHLENHLHDFRGLPLNLERNTKIIPQIVAKIIAKIIMFFVL